MLNSIKQMLEQINNFSDNSYLYVHLSALMSVELTNQQVQKMHDSIKKELQLKEMSDELKYELQAGK